MVKNQIKEFAMRAVFFIAACISILAVILICWFIFSNAFPAIKEIGVSEFLLGTKWKPLNNIFGIFPMIIGSLYVTAIAIAIGVPIGVLCAVFMAKYCPKKLYRFIKPAIDLLAGIPSVVYGFFGLVVIVPAVRQIFGGGKSVFTAAILLAIMILPTVISISEASLRAVPQSYYEGALALGATKERSIFGVSLPSAKSGVSAGIILGIGRAIGETTAIVMIAGNQPIIPESIFSGVRTLTTNIILEMGYAQDLHREALIATAAVLFIFILLINLLFSALKGRDSKI
ncbi:MAG: phosphate ABC transporter permease subunit PstC [Eubacterium sp.]|uniref:phosphate ABC transporter permease subunit PstC n=1 Tax=Eubacterium sp. TaxID=142586 RepID=UPI003A32C9D2